MPDQVVGFDKVLADELSELEARRKRFVFRTRIRPKTAADRILLHSARLASAFRAAVSAALRSIWAFCRVWPREGCSLM